jgi:hypothetical protein
VSGDTFTVYRVKYWTFGSGDPPALQLEYAPPFSVSDTNGVRQLAARIWPAFAPYVTHLHLNAAVLTATNLDWSGNDLAWTSRMHHYGVTAARQPDGRWYIAGSTVPLPPEDSSGTPRIIEASGQPMAFMVVPPGP